MQVSCSQCFKIMLSSEGHNPLITFFFYYLVVKRVKKCHSN